mgnify:CR=1 FL=1
MKLSSKQIDRLVTSIFNELKSQSVITFKVDEEKVFQRAVKAINDNIDAERDLDQKVNDMMDDLERQHPGEFQRFKMFPMLKKKLAQEQGFVL